MSRNILLLVLILGFAGGCANAQRGAGPAPGTLPTDEPPAPAADDDAGKRKLALLVGINTYKYPKSVSRLDGPANDVEDMTRVLTSAQYGFKRRDVRVLTNGDATRAGILAAIDTHLVASARPGDIVVFYYSGHGSLMDNPNDPSGKDNTIVPYDSRDPDKKVWDIRDKELNVRLLQLAARVGRTGGVTFILDSCHSGTGLRMAGRVRAVDPDMRFGRTPPPIDVGAATPSSRDTSGGAPAVADVNYVLIAGSRTDQLSFEGQRGSEGRVSGALTYHLARELLRPSAVRRTYRDVMDRVIPAVRGDFPNQTPQLEGADADRVLFGDETLTTQRYVLARPLGGERVELEGGQLHGFTPDSEFAVYGPDDHMLAPPAAPLTVVTLKAVGPMKSEGTMSPIVTLPPSAKAVGRRHVFGVQKTRVLYEGPSAAVARIKAFVEKDPARPFEAVGPDQPFLIRVAEVAGHVRTFGPDGLELSTPIPSNHPNLEDTMERRLLHWARWFGMLSLRNPGSSIEVQVTLLPRGGRPVAQPGRIPSFVPGEKRFDVMVKNRTDRKVFIYIVDLTSAGKVQQVYPDPGSHVPVDPQGEALIQEWNVSLPADTVYVRDVLKVIAATHQVDLWYLQMDTPKGADRQSGDDPLGRLLYEAAAGVRDTGRSVPDEWATAEAAFEVCKEVNSDSAGRCKP